MEGIDRKDIKPGMDVYIVLKKDQHTGKLSRGIVKDILTKSARHPHGIKVQLVDGRVGRVKKILDSSNNKAALHVEGMVEGSSKKQGV